MKPQPDAPEEPFAQELAIALDAIDNLTKDECAGIVSVVNGARCEPVTAFLLLHAQLSYVFASPHGQEFRSCLSAWGANRLLDSLLLKHWAGWYRCRYIVGLSAAGAVKWLRENLKESWLIVARPRASDAHTRQCEERDPKKAAAVVAFLSGLRVGDVFRHRFSTWPEGEWHELELLQISSRGSFICRSPGKKSKETWSRKFIEWRTRIGECQLEVVRKAAAAESGEEVRAD